MLVIRRRTPFSITQIAGSAPFICEPVAPGSGLSGPEGIFATVVLGYSSTSPHCDPSAWNACGRDLALASGRRVDRPVGPRTSVRRDQLGHGGGTGSADAGITVSALSDIPCLVPKRLQAKSASGFGIA